MQPHYTTLRLKNQAHVFIYDRVGHRVASVIDRTLYRTVHERGLLHDPEALAFDRESLGEARKAGAEVLVLTLADRGKKLRVRLADYYTLGFSFDYGRGEQIGLPLSRFEIIEGEQSEQTAEQLVFPFVGAGA
jgi:hypothetical protein